MDHHAEKRRLTTDFLAPDILNRCGRAVPPEGRGLHSTLRPVSPIAEGLKRAGSRLGKIHGEAAGADVASTNA